MTNDENLSLSLLNIFNEFIGTVVVCTVNYNLVK